MKHPHPKRCHAVCPDEGSAWPKDSIHFGKQPVLHRARGHMMQHGETYRAVECAVCKRRLGRTAAKYFDIGFGEALLQLAGQVRINLKAGEAAAPATQPVRR